MGLAPQTTEMTERTFTMKTYLLRNQNTVEPQKTTRRQHAGMPEHPPLTPPRRGTDLWSLDAADVARWSDDLDAFPSWEGAGVGFPFHPRQCQPTSAFQSRVSVFHIHSGLQ